MDLVHSQITSVVRTTAADGQVDPRTSGTQVRAPRFALACLGSLLSLQAAHQAGVGLPTEGHSPPWPRGGCTDP